jgi:hypothetical protein
MAPGTALNELPAGAVSDSAGALPIRLPAATPAASPTASATTTAMILFIAFLPAGTNLRDSRPEQYHVAELPPRCLQNM